MANSLGYYNPEFYAQEALIQLENALGMARAVYMGYDEERRSFDRGEYINIKRPSTFTAQDAPSSAQDATTDQVQVQLSNWREVKFALTDKELAFSEERIIADHIRPAAYALANDIDQKLAARYADVPWSVQENSTFDIANILEGRKQLFDNGMPMGTGQQFAMIDSQSEADLLALSAFTQDQGAGGLGVQSQIAGTLGQRYGFQFFANQNVQTHTAGSLTGSPLTNGAVAVGATSVALDAGSLTGTVKAGDIITFAGDTNSYAITADATAAGNAITVSVSPAIKAAIGDGVAATVSQNTSIAESLMFHRNAFALVTAPLSEMGNELGASIATVQDPITGLSLRSRMYYDGDNSKVNVALDVLYGVKTLDPYLAVRVSDY
jgi:hypothetical protein